MSELRAEASSRAGQLTSIMRTVRAESPAEAPEALRVAVVVDGKVVDERTFCEPSSVTFGGAERDSFVVRDGAGLPSLALFGPSKRGAFELRIPRDAKGRISHLGTIQSPDEWLAAGQSSLALERGSKGRLDFGAFTVLFSYDMLPQAVASAVLAPALKRGFGIDWSTTIVAALSFLFHFGALGAIYSDWADPTEDDGLTISKLVESVRELPSLPQVEEPEQAQASETAAAATHNQPVREQSERKSTPVSGRPVAARGSSRSMTEADAANLSDQLGGMDTAMLATLNPSGVNTDRVLESSNLPASMLDNIARDARGTGRPGQLAFGPNGPGAFGTEHDLATLGNRGHGDPDRGVGSARPPEPVRPKAAIDPATPPRGPEQIPGLEGAIGGLQGGFRRCYQSGLDHENPDMAGGVRVTVKIGPNGEVMSASPAVTGNLSAGVVSCMVRKISGAQFPKTPSGSPAVFVVPISVKKQ